MQIIIDIQAGDSNRTLSLIRQIVDEPQPIRESIGETVLNRNRDRRRQQADPEDTLASVVGPGAGRQQGQQDTR